MIHTRQIRVAIITWISYFNFGTYLQAYALQKVIQSLGYTCIILSDEKLVQIKSLEALEEIAKGDANKIFIPFEATSVLSSLGTAKEIFTDEKK